MPTIIETSNTRTDRDSREVYRETEILDNEDGTFTKRSRSVSRWNGLTSPGEWSMVAVERAECVPNHYTRSMMTKCPVCGATRCQHDSRIRLVNRGDLRGTPVSYWKAVS